MTASDHLSDKQFPAKDQLIHRGMYLNHPSGRNPEDIHDMLVGSAGSHWTPNWQTARNQFAGSSGDLHVGFVLHGTHPGSAGIMDARTQRERGVVSENSTASYDKIMHSTEKEVPIQPGHPVHVHGITILGKRDGSWPPENRKPIEPDQHFAVDWNMRA